MLKINKEFVEKNGNYSLLSDDIKSDIEKNIFSMTEINEICKSLGVQPGQILSYSDEGEYEYIHTLYLADEYDHEGFPIRGGNTLFCFKSNEDFDVISTIKDITREFLNSHNGKVFLAYEYGPYAEIPIEDLMGIARNPHYGEDYNDSQDWGEFLARGINVSVIGDDDGDIDPDKQDLYYEYGDDGVTVSLYGDAYFLI